VTCPKIGWPPGFWFSEPAPSCHSQPRAQGLATECERGRDLSALAGTPNAEYALVTNRASGSAARPRSIIRAYSSGLTSILTRPVLDERVRSRHYGAELGRVQVTTEPVQQRKIRTRRRPSLSSISRTRRRSATAPVSTISTSSRSCQAEPGRGKRDLLRH
jgi:hypothetical protein